MAIDPACHARPASGGGLARLLPELVGWHLHNSTRWASPGAQWLEQHTPVPRVYGSILPPGGGENFSQQDAEDESSPATNGRGEEEKGKRKKKWESLWRHLIGAPGQVTKSLHLIGQAKPNQLAGRMF